jgi:hypothetical protein
MLNLIMIFCCVPILVGPRWGFVTCKGPKGWDMAEFCLRRTMVWAKAKPIRPLQYFGLTIQSPFGPGKQGKIIDIGYVLDVGLINFFFWDEYGLRYINFKKNKEIFYNRLENELRV